MSCRSRWMAWSARCNARRGWRWSWLRRICPASACASWIRSRRAWARASSRWRRHAAAALGSTLEEVVAAAERVSERVRLVVTLDTLEYLARASRIPQVAALLGGMLAIKPMVLHRRGAMFTRWRGARPAAARIEQLLEQCANWRRRGRAPARRRAARARRGGGGAGLEARIRAAFDCVEVYTTEFTPVMGGYCGPGLLGVAFLIARMPMPPARTRAGTRAVVAGGAAYLYGSAAAGLSARRRRRVDLKRLGRQCGGDELASGGGVRGARRSAGSSMPRRGCRHRRLPPPRLR